MSFVPMADLMGRAFRGGYAVPAFCTWNAESMEVVLDVAERMHAPVILMQGPGEFSLLSPRAMAAAARAMEGLHHASAALHLDHGDSMEMVRACIEARYTSVMLDFSARSFEENVQALRDVVALARPLGISVEGEIGKIGKADDATAEGGVGSAYTKTADAVRYVKETGVDFLAVSVGNKHGFYQGAPHLEFGLLAELHAAVSVPLVMHGGTGIPEKDIQRSIGMGVAKVNVASELVHGVRESLSAQWGKGANLWTPLAMGEAKKIMVPIVEKWFRVTGAEGRA